MHDITEILSAIDSGDPSATEKLLPFVYDELRKLAAQRMTHESPDHTLQATALVHEAYLRLVNGSEATQWNSRGHFFSAAAEAMRRILVESARKKLGPRRGGHFGRVDIEGLPDLPQVTAGEVLAISEALSDFEQESPQAAQLVKLRYFGGMSQQEAANCLDVSRAKADRLWAYAKASLFAALRDE